MKVVIVAFDDFTDIDVFLPWDILNRVRLVGKREDWEVKIVGTKKSHMSMAGLEIPTHGTVDEIKDADAVIFASGIGVQTLIKDERYLATIELDLDKQLIGSMCSGALILGSLGMLNGKKATTYPTAVEQLKTYGVDVVKESFVQQGNIATAAGCLAAEELSAWVIRELIDEEMVNVVLASIQPVS
jgi:transcriptional regulator GlxA family with amidase domain